MEKRLYNATKNGDKNELLYLLQEDAQLLNRFINGRYPETPLHVAIMLGHSKFVDELLTRMPELANELNSRSQSPLHLAAATGHQQIVTRLMQVNPDMCLVCDLDGRNPLHIAAMKGYLDVLLELFYVKPWATRSLMAQGDTILHGCVRCNQLEALKFLVTEGISDQEFVNCLNYEGNTILHMAIVANQTQAIKFLIRREEVDKNCKNKDGFKALDLLSQNQIDEFANDESLSDVIRNNILSSKQEPDQSNAIPKSKRSNVDWLERKCHNLILAASLLANMAFHAAVNPPSGVWQDNDTSHRAGHSVFADTNPNTYTQFLISNTFGFMASLIIIQLLISGLPIRRKLFKWVLMVVMSVAIAAMVFAYAVSLVPLTSDPAYSWLFIRLWTIFMILLFAAQEVRLMIKFFKFVGNLIMRFIDWISSEA
ncbi:hypothetical protein Godav_003580 [Gossypium davidsonii]|uniref:PGG domain-containing protein n=2 Tax=Gossypium TaxID=3633 RepID=A0A7J8SIU0_GOSDV|nr:hypothetical protein [Gossypium davidsonii]